MVARAALLLVFFRLLAPAEPPPAGPRTLGIFVAPQDYLPPIVSAEMAREVDTILDVPDVEILWRRLEDSSRQEVFNWIVVVQLVKGSEIGESGLGFTHVSEGSVLPFAQIDCGRLRWLLQTVTAGETPIKKDFLFGRALGRVVAHEIYHILARTTDHSEDGVAKPSLTAEELIAPTLSLDPDALARITEEMGLQPQPTETR